MRMILATIAALVFVTHANADYLNAQFGNPLGFSQGNGKLQCANPVALPYVQCVPVTGGVHGIAGTFTVKRPNIEVLLQLKCGPDGAGQIVWAGERFVGTSDISVAGLGGMPGPCWFLWQEINSTGYAIPNDDFEYQVVVW